MEYAVATFSYKARDARHQKSQTPRLFGNLSNTQDLYTTTVNPTP